MSRNATQSPVFATICEGTSPRTMPQKMHSSAIRRFGLGEPVHDHRDAGDAGGFEAKSRSANLHRPKVLCKKSVPLGRLDPAFRAKRDRYGENARVARVEGKQFAAVCSS